jgi:hypothetical protein
LWLQQAALVVQLALSAVHVGAAQTLLVHVPPQQSLP